MPKRITLSDLFILFVFAFLIATIFGVPIVKTCGGMNIEYSEGARTGVPYKISKKGLIWKTWEGDLSLQLTTRNSEGQMINQIFSYSVADEKIAKEIEAASQANEVVTLKYKQYLLRGFRYGGTDYDIVEVNRTKTAKN